MKSYEVVKDHKTGLTKVVTREERGHADPFSPAALRRMEIGKRSRVAWLKAWLAGFRYSWQDRRERMRILSHVLFFVALLVVPLLTALVAVLSSILRLDSERALANGGPLVTVLLVSLALSLLFGASLVVQRIFWRKP